MNPPGQSSIDDILTDIHPPKKAMFEVIGHLKLSQQLHIVSRFTALYVVIWCSTTGQVCHIFITAENALISVNIQLLLLCF